MQSDGRAGNNIWCNYLQVRLLREGGDVQAVPGGHARPGDGKLPGRQPAMLDADPGQFRVKCRVCNNRQGDLAGHEPGFSSVFCVL